MPIKTKSFALTLFNATAKEVLKTVSKLEPRRRRNPEFEVLQTTLFLSGIEKNLNLAIIFLYISGKIEWHWMKPNFPISAGILVCYPGFAKKILKLKALGFDVYEEFYWLAELRNKFIHGIELSARYKIDSVERSVRVHGPEVGGWGTFQVGGSDRHFKGWFKSFNQRLASFVDSQGFPFAWEKFREKLENLPEISAVESRVVIETLEKTDFESLERINRRYIGEGCSRLLPIGK